MSHHEHDPMKGHHHPAAQAKGGWNLFNRIRRRSNAGDHVVPGDWPYPTVGSLSSGHKDEPLSPRARLLWWLAGLAITAAGITLIVLSR
jgi:hypothetical protein